MFRKILIANRGEIACRVIRTARRMGIRTIAVYSEADRNALHVALADEAHCIGPPPAVESYLNIDAVVDACRKSSAEAVHPGYGFLSENPLFVDAIERAGLVFIGPSAAAIRAMGLKDAAKTLMEDAGVPIVPGYHGAEQSAERLAAHAAAIGYPVLIKARAGGGGKGMRRVGGPEDFRAALEGACREAEAAFGDGRVLIEKYMAKPRHIEVQVFGDSHGNVVHLFERDCSAQRRHQKVIEEAPAPGVTPEMRGVMGEAAVRAAKAIGYIGAGTVEFIADVSEGLREDRFFFMEMNTRLQVEHPVTEAITGLDLVEWQLRVAAGEPLPRKQDELAIGGWAFEARIYAENPARDFLPATGRLSLFEAPEGARVDSGVRTGDEITPFYDPMIAKLVTHGRDRDQALKRLEAALRDCRIAGVTTNTAFLSRLCRLPELAAGDVDTGLIARAGEALTAEEPATKEAWALAALAAAGMLREPEDRDPWIRLRGFRLWGDAWQSVRVRHQDEEHEIRIDPGEAGHFTVRVAEGELSFSLRAAEDDWFHLDFGDRAARAKVVREGLHLAVFLDGAGYQFSIPDALAGHAESGAGGDRLTAPMPGLVRLVSVEPGTEVAKGDPLITMEAMKMELVLAAPRDGKVAELFIRSGDQVEEGALLLRLEEETDG
ncbi:MAG: acetyl/propionyl/methylcrotonyl-CoA carboxylase subunit alpha [Shinella sp.]|nr:acetyl/propionyl/methylcrotonyl-CoA carboxylase subunit alpha [Shinella sp.]